MVASVMLDEGVGPRSGSEIGLSMLFWRSGLSEVPRSNYRDRSVDDVLESGSGWRFEPGDGEVDCFGGEGVFQRLRSAPDGMNPSGNDGLGEKSGEYVKVGESATDLAVVHSDGADRLARLIRLLCGVV
ncbi:DNA binding [Striga asiatica]|uniref:DNA binding n=1 Tax=Striga asiatica TaxID=4170 RepID=A0A5A7PEF0_STRAF|nr:DNA binding [Striga asiatica]